MKRPLYRDTGVKTLHCLGIENSEGVNKGLTGRHYQQKRAHPKRISP